MKQNKSSPNRSQKPARATRPFAAAGFAQSETGFAPSAAKKASFSIVKQTLLPWREMQRWLAAEAELIAEHNLARVHRIHDRTH
ncbi:MAG: hypothetical protein ABR955_06820 [Verrucomicrobiota bacterium]